MGPYASAALDGWDIWSTTAYDSTVTWSAKPVGALSAVLRAPTKQELQARIGAYMRDVDAHVREAREKLDALPADWTGERQVQERLIDALANLVSA